RPDAPCFLDGDGPPLGCCWTGYMMAVASQAPVAEPFYDLLVELTNGLGATEHVTYSAHSPAGVSDPDPVYTPGHGCAYPESCVKRGPPLVKSHTVDQPGGLADRVFEYRYQGAHADLRGRGRVGFERVIAIDVFSGSSTETQYDLTREEVGSDHAVYPYAGLPKKRVRRVLFPEGE